MAGFQTGEICADLTLKYVLPLYYELKVLIILSIVSGPRVFHDTIVDKELTKREKVIDKYLRKVFKARDKIIAAIWNKVSTFSEHLLITCMTSAIQAASQPKPNLSADPTPMDEEASNEVAVANVDELSTSTIEN